MEDTGRLSALSTNDAVLSAGLARVVEDVEKLNGTIESLREAVADLQKATERHSVTLERLLENWQRDLQQTHTKLGALETRVSATEHWIDQARWPVRIVLGVIAAAAGMVVLYVYNAVEKISPHI